MADSAASRVGALGHWARALRLDDVPADVLQLARWQLAHIDQRVSAAAAAGPDLVASNARDAALYAAWDGDAHILGGRTGVGIAVLRSLSPSPALTVERLLLATVVGMEIGARIGLATLLSDRLALSSARPGAAAGAAALAWLGAADGDTIANAVVGAVGLVAGAADGAGFGTVVAEAALGGFNGAGNPDGEALWQGVAEPLPDCLAAPGTGDGGRWLTRALVLPELCAPVTLATAVEGLREILRRHVKAAEKRLRAEQVDRIEVRAALPTWAAERLRPRLAELIGRLVTFHELGPVERASGERAAEIRAVAERVEVTHDWALSAGFAASAQEWTGPMSLQRLRALRTVTTLPGMPLGELPALLKARPDRLFRAGATAAPSPLCWPVQIRLYTTRGGWWPERRQLADSLGADPVPTPFDLTTTAAAGALLGAAG